jgi:hypothetical protein
MRKWNEQSFFKGKSLNGQKTHEEMLSISGHKGNANWNHIKSPPHLLEWLPSNTKTTNVGKDVGEKEPSYTAGGNVN